MLAFEFCNEGTLKDYSLKVKKLIKNNANFKVNNY